MFLRLGVVSDLEGYPVGCINDPLRVCSQCGFRGILLRLDSYTSVCRHCTDALFDRFQHCLHQSAEHMRKQGRRKIIAGSVVPHYERGQLKTPVPGLCDLFLEDGETECFKYQGTPDALQCLQRRVAGVFDVDIDAVLWISLNSRERAEFDRNLRFMWSWYWEGKCLEDLRMEWTPLSSIEKETYQGYLWRLEKAAVCSSVDRELSDTMWAKLRKPYVDELLAVTWRPERVRDWCMPYDAQAWPKYVQQDPSLFR